MQPSPIPLFTDGNVSAASVLWTYRGRLQLTFVVKAAFALRAGDIAALAPPPPIQAEERTFGKNPARSLECASDLALYKARCDVTLIGHAFAPQTRLALAASDNRRLLDKVLHVPTASPTTRVPLVYERALGGPGAPNPVGVANPAVVDPVDPRRAGSYAPLSPFWSVRKQLASGLEKGALDGPIATVPEALSWDYFQSAPRDQQVDHLEGGEWLVLDGVHPTAARFQSRLPIVRGAARVFAPSGEIGVALALDTLAIDADAMTISLVWRGRRELAESESSILALRIGAAIEQPGAGVDWSTLVASAPVASAAAEGTEATFALQPKEHKLATERVIAPFAIAAPPAREGGAPPSSPSASSAEASSAMAGLPFGGNRTVGPDVTPASAAGDETFVPAPRPPSEE